MKAKPIYVAKEDRVACDAWTVGDAWLPEEDYLQRLEEIAKQAFLTWDALARQSKPTASQKLHLDRLEMRLRLLERPTIDLRETKR